MGQIDVKQLGLALGAQVTGIDLRQPLNDLARKEILDAWQRHLVLVSATPVSRRTDKE
ncbi:MAG: hypothetical protein ACXWCY_10780 [Burkholderiales bacterium]